MKEPSTRKGALKIITASRSDSHSSNDSFLITGHIVIDQIFDRVGQVSPRVSLGGPISYSSLTLASLGKKSEVRTRVGYDFPHEYEDFLKRNAGVDASKYKAPNHRTTSYRIDRTHSPRRMWLLSRCRPITMQDFASYLREDSPPTPDTLIVNTVANEISLSLLERISKEFELVMADSQGFVRKLPRIESQEITLRDGLDISSLSGVDVLKADLDELSCWSGSKDTESSIRQISKFVELILLTSGPGVVDLYHHGKLALRARPFEVAVSDTTGAGDIMLASFASKFSEDRNITRSLAFSVSAATLAVRNFGVEKGLLDPLEVEARSHLVKISSA